MKSTRPGASAAVTALVLAAWAGDGRLEAQRAVAPPLPFESTGTCPFSGCVYREWTAVAPVITYADRTDKASVAFTVANGETVTAIDGVVITRRPGRVRFEESQRVYSSSGVLDLRPDDTLLLLVYQADGGVKAWYNGLLYEDVDSSSFASSVCDDDPKLCPGRVVEQPRTDWWVQVRNARGQVGWTRDPQKFDSSDNR